MHHLPFRPSRICSERRNASALLLPAGHLPEFVAHTARYHSCPITICRRRQTVDFLPGSHPPRTFVVPIRSGQLVQALVIPFVFPGNDLDETRKLNREHSLCRRALYHLRSRTDRLQRQWPYPCGCEQWPCPCPSYD